MHVEKGREPKVPADLRKVLAASARAKAQWEDLTPIAQRDFVSWIESAKQPETRKRRVESVPSRLASGKRRPCCYAVVPMNLYSALKANPKAKAQWKQLSPDERRDLIGWISAAKDSDGRGLRVAEGCNKLAAGERVFDRHPGGGARRALHES
jgi:uncharacterized protein YdeI (YjbR/CyaY-like superfamily)